MDVAGLNMTPSLLLVLKFTRETSAGIRTGVNLLARILNSISGEYRVYDLWQWKICFKRRAEITLRSCVNRIKAQESLFKCP